MSSKIERRRFLEVLSTAGMGIALSPVMRAFSRGSFYVPEKDMGGAANLEDLFKDPPEDTKPGVWWHWMGSNVSKEGITRDLEAVKENGFRRVSMFSMADTVNPWSGVIGNSPTPEIIAWSKPWWEMVRFAAEESKRLGLDFGMHNCPGYEASGGAWISPEHSMQELCWSKQEVSGGVHFMGGLERPEVDVRAQQDFPVYDPETGKPGFPKISSRGSYYKDIAVIAIPSKKEIIPKDQILNLTEQMDDQGNLNWDVPNGNWTVYRFGHTTRGTLIQPAQWQATGLECDKLNKEAVSSHMDHVIDGIQKHLGDLIGEGFNFVLFDSYEAGTSNWTPLMREEFSERRGYDILNYLPVFDDRVIEDEQAVEAFEKDFDDTIKDLYRDVYFQTIAEKLNRSNLKFVCEPYGGTWRQEEVVLSVDNVMAEFWAGNGEFNPDAVSSTVSAAQNAGKNVIRAEAFTGKPDDSKWNETPAWLKPIGDGAFCAGINCFDLHDFTHQPWEDKYRPGNTLGLWGTHFTRMQTWWKPFKAMVAYWHRCQTLLQWGKLGSQDDFSIQELTSGITVRGIHRRDKRAHVFFLANISNKKGKAHCVFNVSDMKPELWDPVTREMFELYSNEAELGKTGIDLDFDEAQSFFIVFREAKVSEDLSSGNNFFEQKEAMEMTGSWEVKFDPDWGGPKDSVIFMELEDWTKSSEKGIKYYSGTAVYSKSFVIQRSNIEGHRDIYLDLGEVNHIARVMVNGSDLGVIWTAPWRVKLPVEILEVNKENILKIEVTNVWANRLIGDEQESSDCKWGSAYHFDAAGGYLKEFPEWFLKNKPRPSKKRYCFSTWNYFTKNSTLISSGLLGPVTLFF